MHVLILRLESPEAVKPPLMRFFGSGGVITCETRAINSKTKVRIRLNEIMGRDKGLFYR